jgi:IMP dehydrogenase
MRTGAVGILVGVGTGSASTTWDVLGLGAPHATAIADAAGARSRHLEETGVYVHVVADGGMSTGGDIAKAIACGADAVMIGAPLAAAAEAPGGRRYWEMAAAHPSLPRGSLVEAPLRGTLAEVLCGPAHDSDGAVNLFGALRAAMAMCGYASVKEMHKADVTVAG